MSLLSRVRNLTAGLVSLIGVRLIDVCIAQAKTRLKNEEQKLVERLSRLLSIPKDKISVSMLPYPDGSILPFVELKVGLSQMQLDRAQEFFDGSSAIKQNVRRPTPAVN